MVGRTKAIDSVSYLQTILTGWYLIFHRYHKHEEDLIDDPTSTESYMFILTQFKDQEQLSSTGVSEVSAQDTLTVLKLKNAIYM